MKDQELIHEFVVESMDLLENVEPKLIELQHLSEETGDVDADTINAVFRLFHSMKGGAGMLNLKNVQSLTHTAETLLDLFRKGTLKIRREHIDVLLSSTDLIKEMLNTTDRTLADEGFESEVETLKAELNQFIQAKSAEKTEAAAAPAAAQSTAEKPAVEAAPAAEPVDFTLDISKEMKDRFVNEAFDLLDQTEQALLAVEQNFDAEQMNLAFRCIHSVKGNSGFMGFSDLQRLSHRMESAMDGLRNGTIANASEIYSTLLHCVDVLRGALALIAQEGTSEIDNVDLYVDLIGDLLQKHDKGATASSAPQAERLAVEKVTEAADAKEKEAVTAVAASAPSAPSAEKKIPQAIVTHNFERQDIRVDLQKLDALINLVGELVIAEAMVTRHPSITAHEDESVEQAIHQLRRVSRDLQDVAMSVRMIPLANTFQKMIRLVHDLSNKSGKKASLEISGEDTEVDKTVIENINDPLVHIVRNALDHGIESPEDRKEAGKSEVATVRIDGRHEGGEVWISISDDGRGLNRDKILKKAIEKGIVRGDGSELSDRQVFKLIFEPGFSTADKITDVSGRGVGMDVVKKNIEKLKGRVDIKSIEGEGTTFILRIPLTLAIIDGMLVRVGRSRFIIPILAIQESLQPSEDQVTVTPDGDEIVRVRDEFYSIIRLHELFKIVPDQRELSQGILVVVESDSQTFALFVDEILGQQETVIKGLSNYFQEIKGVSGCTILGNGEVSLILDVSAMTGSVQDNAHISV